MPGYGSGGYGFGLYGGGFGTDGVHVLLDDGTGTFPIDITSKVLIGPGIALSRGRQDWQGGVTAGAMSLTLNNADGRFTPGSTFYGSPSPIKVDQRIRVIDTVDGGANIRFTGYVKSWPVAWPATVSSWSTVQIVATDAQARAERRVLRSPADEEILEIGVSAYYPLLEAAGAVRAADLSGNEGPFLRQVGTGSAVVFGSGGGAQFAGGMYLTAETPLAQPANWSLVLVFNTSSASNMTIMEGPVKNVALAINAGSLTYSGSAIGSGLAAGTNQVVGLSATAGTVTKYLNGASTGTVAVAGNEGFLNLGAASNGSTPFTGTLRAVGYFSSALTAAQMSTLSDLLLGIQTEAGTARLTRLAGYANLPLGTLDTSLTPVPFVDFTGRSLWDALQQVADAEMGVPFFDGSGNLTFHNRNRPAAKTAPDLTLMSSYITPDVQPVTDDQQMVNYFESASETTQVTQVAKNAASETAHGRYSGSASYLVQTDQEAIDRANWIVANFAEPTTRYGTITINLFKMTAAQASTVLAAIEIDCWLRVVSMPTQNTTGATADVVVEGYAEEITANSWKLTCNVVSKSLTDCLILDDPVRGVLDAGNRLYV